MTRSLIAIFALALVLFPFAACGEDTKELTGAEMGKTLQSLVDSIDLDGAKSKIANLAEGKKAEAEGVLSQLESKKSDAMSMIKDLASAKGEGLVKMLKDAGGMQKSLNELWGKLKGMIGM